MTGAHETMTTDKPGTRPAGTVEQAMNRVLEAERGAEQAVEACGHDAMKIVQAAQQQAKRIARRANERLAICHVRCNAKITREIRQRERAAAGQRGEASYRLDEAALTAVVEALALALTGVTPSGKPAGDR